MFAVLMQHTAEDPTERITSVSSINGPQSIIVTHPESTDRDLDIS